MRKVLIIAMSLEIGGAEKSLVNLLNLMDYSKYEIDLFLFQNKGTFIKQVPSKVNIIDNDDQTKILFQSFKKTINCSKKKYLQRTILSAKRYYFTFIATIRCRQFDRIRLYRWNHYFSKHIPKLKKEYDIAIAYSGGETMYYMVEKVIANRKITYYHSDYSKIPIDNSEEDKFLKKVDSIVTISEACKNSLCALFPEHMKKIFVFSNLTCPSIINSLANEYYPSEYKLSSEKTIIVSIGRLHHIKGFDLAIEAAQLLKLKGCKFKWFIVGDGIEWNNLQKQLENNNLIDEFILLGAKDNPYPYLKYADIVVQTSRFEGKSVALDEAKILCKPIVTTNYNSVEDQIENGITGIIVPLNAFDISDGLEKLIMDDILKNNLISNLKQLDFSIDTKIDEYSHFIDGA